MFSLDRGFYTDSWFTTELIRITATRQQLFIQVWENKQSGTLLGAKRAAQGHHSHSIWTFKYSFYFVRGDKYNPDK